MSKPRVKVQKSAKAGDIIEIKTLISHKMETGIRKDRKTGKLIPRNIINEFTATFDGKEVFKGKLHPSISANPYFSFHMKATKSGEFVFTWKDDSGKSWSAKRPLTVN